MTTLAAPLRAFVHKRAPAGADLDDLVQDILVRVVEHLPSLRDAERIDAWIFQIARNVLADSFRRRDRSPITADRDATIEAAAAPDAPDADGERSAAAELASCLAPMIALLPEPYRTAIELTDLQGLTQAEAARRAGLSLSGMKSRVQRGRDQLEAIMTASCAIALDVRGGVTDCEPRRRKIAGACVLSSARATPRS